jgi:hypothetical protein
LHGFDNFRWYTANTSWPIGEDRFRTWLPRYPKTWSPVLNSWRRFILGRRRTYPTALHTSGFYYRQ